MSLSSLQFTHQVIVSWLQCENISRCYNQCTISHTSCYVSASQHIVRIGDGQLDTSSILILSGKICFICTSCGVIWQHTVQYWLASCGISTLKTCYVPCIGIKCVRQRIHGNSLLVDDSCQRSRLNNECALLILDTTRILGDVSNLSTISFNLVLTYIVVSRITTSEAWQFCKSITWNQTSYIVVNTIFQIPALSSTSVLNSARINGNENLSLRILIYSELSSTNFVTIMVLTISPFSIHLIVATRSSSLQHTLGEGVFILTRSRIGSSSISCQNRHCLEDTDIWSGCCLISAL